MRYRVIRKRITPAQYDSIPRRHRYNYSLDDIVYIPQKMTLGFWVSMEPDKICRNKSDAEARIFLEKAGEEIVVSEFMTKDDPLYRIK